MVLEKSTENVWESLPFPFLFLPQLKELYSWNRTSDGHCPSLYFFFFKKKRRKKEKEKKKKKKKTLL